MRYIVVALSIGLGFSNPSTCWADVDEVRSTLQTLLTGPDDNLLPIPPDLLSRMEADIGAATSDQVRSLLPLGRKCLQTRSVATRGSGVLLFTVVALRLDGSTFLGPYVDDFAALMNEPDVGLKNGAIHLLGRSNLPKALAILAAHLDDQRNSSQQIYMMAAPLLESRDAVNVKKVLDLVQRRPDLQLKSGIVRMLGLYGVRSEEALRLIGSGFGDQEADTRRASLDAVGRLPRGVRNRFTRELQLLATLDDVPAIRSTATQLLISSEP